MVLSDLSWFWVICDGSVWSEPILHNLGRFWVSSDGSVWSPIRSTIFELCSNFVQKWGPQPPKVVLPQFWRRIRIRRLRKHLQPPIPPKHTNLCDLSWFGVICDGSTWSEWVLRDQWLFCVITAGLVWSVMVLCDMWQFYVIQCAMVPCDLS